MAVTGIQVGDEVTIRWQNEQQERIVGVVTYNTKEHFCWIMPDGITYHTSRAMANPIKTGRHFDVKSFLKLLQN